MSLMAGVVSWHAAAFALAGLIASRGLRLLTEEQRQQAFRAVVSAVPAGAAVVMQHDGRGGRHTGASLGARVSCQSQGRP